MEEKHYKYFARSNNLEFKETEKFGELFVNELLGVSVYKYPDLEYAPCPNKRIGSIFKSIEHSKNKLGIIVRLITLAGITPALWSLLTRGISSGLSGGTMDIIYRVGIPNKVIDLLDNIDIAVGSYQRRFQIEEILVEQIMTGNFTQIISIAGGSGLIPIEAICKSKKSMRLTNIDKSDKALEKMKNNLARGEDTNQIIEPEYIKEDFSKNPNINFISDGRKIIECTGYFEYLNLDDKITFIKNLLKILNDEDVLILTALTQNPQNLLFEKIGFKKLFPVIIDELFKVLQENNLHIEKAFITPNNTYTTMIITKFR